MSRRRAWLEIVLVLVLVEASGLTVVVLAYLLAEHLPLPVLILAQGLAVLAGLSLLLARAGQRWRDVGLHALRARDAGRALVLFAACMGANLLLMLIVQLADPGYAQAHMERLQVLASTLVDDLPTAVIAAIMVFVGVYEELTARGVLLNRCCAALDGVWAPVLLSSVLFGLGHAYQGWIGVTQTSVVGAILAFYTLRWGTLWPAILAHALLDTLSVAALAGLDAQHAAPLLLP
jgi:membrane protease YdiL (CAAX protease family)